MADLLLQILGLSVWIMAAALLAWGLRMALDRPLSWPWLPVVCLPLALLAASGWLATLHPLPPDTIWPFRVGLGGFVGDFLFAHFQPRPDATLYGWLSGIAAVLLGVGALGLRWGESSRALGRVADASAWAGRQMGDVAGRAARASGDLLSRPETQAPTSSAPQPRVRRRIGPAMDEEKPRGPLARLGGWILRDEDKAPPAEPSLRRVRSRLAERDADAPPMPEAPSEIGEKEVPTAKSRTLLVREAEEAGPTG